MSKNDYLIRLERKEDYPVVENLIREAFWNVYRPGCMEHYLITQLREHSDYCIYCFYGNRQTCFGCALVF